MNFDQIQTTATVLTSVAAQQCTCFYL